MKIDNDVITNLPNEIIELILVDDISPLRIQQKYMLLSQTCSRFDVVLKLKKDALLPHIRMKFPENAFESLRHFHNNIKVSVRKTLKTFGPYSGEARNLAQIFDDKKWKSAWLIINPDKHSWYITERYYWKCNEKAIPFEEKNDKLCWLENDLHNLHFKDEEILQSLMRWLNNRIVDVAQKLIYLELGANEDYKSVLNAQKRLGPPYHAVKNEHIQLLYDGSGHWLHSFIAMEGSRFLIVWKCPSVE